MGSSFSISVRGEAADVKIVRVYKYSSSNKNEKKNTYSIQKRLTEKQERGGVSPVGIPVRTEMLVTVVADTPLKPLN